MQGQRAQKRRVLTQGCGADRNPEERWFRFHRGLQARDVALRKADAASDGHRIEAQDSAQIPDQRRDRAGGSVKDGLGPG